MRVIKDKFIEDLAKGERSVVMPLNPTDEDRDMITELHRGCREYHGKPCELQRMGALYRYYSIGEVSSYLIGYDQPCNLKKPTNLREFFHTQIDEAASDEEGVFNPKVGQLVLVSGKNDGEWLERVFLAQSEGVIYSLDVHEYANKNQHAAVMRQSKEMRPLMSDSDVLDEIDKVISGIGDSTEKYKKIVKLRNLVR